MWMLVVVRMISRGAGGQREGVDDGGRALVQQGAFREDAMRQMVFEYVLDDFSTRWVKFELHLGSVLMVDCVECDLR
jgi:hypothetical protein